jgi:hypothetical protein
LAGGVVGAQFKPPVPDELDAALRTEPLVKVVDIPPADGLGGRGIFLQAAAGHVCLWDAPSANALARQGACNPEADVLGGQEMMVNFAYDGGPAARDVKDARLVGIASADVATVEIVMTDGSRRAVPLSRTPRISSRTGSLRAFGYRLPRGDLKRGVGPVAVVALDADGKQIDRQVTGFVTDVDGSGAG